MAVSVPKEMRVQMPDTVKHLETIAPEAETGILIELVNQMLGAAINTNLSRCVSLFSIGRRERPFARVADALSIPDGTAGSLCRRKVEATR
jgi:hypothetical protein